jgi:hypothetical protein
LAITLLRQAHPNYDQLTPEECFVAAEQLYGYWLAILSRDVDLMKDSSSDQGIDQFWREGSFIVACHFVAALEKAEKIILTPGAKPPSRWFPFLSYGINGKGDSRGALCTAEYGFDAAIERRLLSEYLSGIWDSHFMTVVGSAVLGMAPQGWDEFVYWSFQSIGEVALASGKLEHLKLASLLTRMLAARSKDAVHERDQRDFEIRATINSLITEELHDLACRTEKVISRYGEDEVEARFERQLSLLMQSFGFLVISAKRGQRQVDLICIAPGAPGEAFTFLLEAKSTAANYALPTRDARAIQEYVSSVRSVLKTLPPLRLILIVSGNHTKTIDKKITELEASCGIPVRFCGASVLQSLRRQLPGPLDLSQFLKTCTNANKVLNWQNAAHLIQTDAAVRNAHAEFVQKLFKQSTSS